MSATANFLTFYALLGIIALSPLPLASNRPWAWSLMALMVGMLLVSWAVALVRGAAHVQLSPRRLAPIAIPFGLAVVWSLVQVLPLGAMAAAHPLWSEAAEALGMASNGRISVAPDLTLTATMRLICYGGVFVLAVHLCRERARARLALVWLALINLAYALYGAVEFVSGSETILWLDKWAYRGDLTSTFVNRNSYGAYAGVGVLICVALFLHEQRSRHGDGKLGLYFRAERLLSGALPWILAAMTLGTTLMLSHSRGAFLCTGLALLGLLFCLIKARVVKARSGVFACIGILLVGLVVVVTSGDVTAGRLISAGGSEDLARSQIYLGAVQAITAAPWTGYGLGSFSRAFLMVRDGSLDQPVVWIFAHNVFLETAMDLGILGAAGLIGAVVAAVFICLRGLSVRRRDHVYPAVTVSVAILLGVHGLVDFSVQMPAVAVTFAFILGLGVAQSFNTGRKPASDSASQSEAA